jgi:parallel beta-helix repeat protein
MTKMPNPLRMRFPAPGPIRLLVAISAAGAPPAIAQEPLPAIELRPGLVITTSVHVVPGTYRLPAHASLDSAAIVVRGENITVDFAGARLEGLPPDAPPDGAGGVAIRIDGGRNIRIQNAQIRGYRFAILARGTRGLSLVDNDVSYTWKPRLFSLVEHESLMDWLSYHHNDEGQWLRFGAGIYLDGVRGGEISGNRGVQGMNGLLMTRSDSLRIVDNEFAFNSGLGIGMYRSSDNVIMHNRLDYNVRGYSHGFYQRGQDSAGLLLYEQSDRNVIAYNSATHSGDGLFMWAGQTTMDSGTGGVNDNLVYGNDFSYAHRPTRWRPLSAATPSSQTARSAARTGCGVATASSPASSATASPGTDSGWQSSTGRTTSLRTTYSMVTPPGCGSGPTLRSQLIGDT